LDIPRELLRPARRILTSSSPVGKALDIVSSRSVVSVRAALDRAAREELPQDRLAA